MKWRKLSQYVVFWRFYSLNELLSADVSYSNTNSVAERSNRRQKRNMVSNQSREIYSQFHQQALIQWK